MPSGGSRAGGAVRIGTAGWAIPRGLTDRFPRSGAVLERYAARLPAVEINSSFHRPHAASTYARWAAATPSAFRFAVKAPRTITHEARLAVGPDLLDAFLAQIAGLGDRLGPILIQLPPSLAFDPPVAGAFLHALRERFAGAVVCEPRHASWFAAEPEALLAGRQIARVAADPARVPAAASPGGWRGSPITACTARRGYTFQLMAKPSWPTWLAVWRRPPARETWCMFDNTGAGAAAADALALKDRICYINGYDPAGSQGAAEGLRRQAADLGARGGPRPTPAATRIEAAAGRTGRGGGGVGRGALASNVIGVREARMIGCADAPRRPDRRDHRLLRRPEHPGRHGRRRPPSPRLRRPSSNPCAGGWSGPSGAAGARWSRGRPSRPGHLLFRRRRRRRVADRRRRAHLALAVRQGADRADRRAGGGPVRSRHGLYRRGPAGAALRRRRRDRASSRPPTAAAAGGRSAWKRRAMIGRIWVDPHDPNRVLVAAAGRFLRAGPRARRVPLARRRQRRGPQTLEARRRHRRGRPGRRSPAIPTRCSPPHGRRRQYPWQSYFTPIAGPGSGVYARPTAARPGRRIVGGGWPAGATRAGSAWRRRARRRPARLCGGLGRQGRRPLPLRRRRRDLDAGQCRAGPSPAITPAG